MLAQWLAGVGLTGAQHMLDLLRPGRVAQPDGDVGEPLLVADASNRAAFRLAEKFLLPPAEQADQLDAIQIMARREVRLLSRLGEAREGAEQLTQP